MKQWRKDAAAFKEFMVSIGQHHPGARYGKAIRDGRRAMKQINGASPLLLALIGRLGARP